MTYYFHKSCVKLLCINLLYFTHGLLFTPQAHSWYALAKTKFRLFHPLISTQLTNDITVSYRSRAWQPLYATSTKTESTYVVKTRNCDSNDILKWFVDFNAHESKQLYHTLVVNNDIPSFLNAIHHFNPRFFSKAPTSVVNNIIDYIESSLFNGIFANYSTSQVIDTIWYLGKLNPLQSSSNQSKMPKIVNSIFHEIATREVIQVNTNVSRLIQGVATLEVKWKDLNHNYRDKIKIYLFQYLSIMTHAEVVACVYGLGKMDLAWDQLPTYLRDELLSNIHRVLPTCSNVMVSNILWGISRSKAQWSSLSHAVRQSIYQRLVELSPLGSQTLSSSLNALHKMGLTWSDLPAQVQQTIEDSIPGLVHSSEQAVANTVWALGSMNAHYDSLSDDTLLCIQTAFVSVVDSFTSQGFANGLYGLSNIGFISASHSHRDSQIGDPDFIRGVQSMGVTGNATTSLYHHRRESRVLTAKLTRAIQSACLDGSRRSSFELMNGRVLSNVIWSLGAMQFTISSFSSPTTISSSSVHGSSSISSISSNTKSGNKDGQQKGSSMAAASLALVEALSRTLPQMTEQGLSMTLWGLVKMQLRVQDLPTLTRSQLLRATLRVSHSLTARGLGNSLWALANMNFRFQSSNAALNITAGTYDETIMYIDAEVKNALLKSFEALSAAMPLSSLSLCLHSLSRLDLQYTDMSFSLRNALQTAIVRCLVNSPPSPTLSAAHAHVHAYTTRDRSRNSNDSNDSEESTAHTHFVVDTATGTTTGTSADEVRVDYEVANIVHALGKMNAKFVSLKSSCQAALLATITTQLPRMAEQDLGNVAWGLWGQLELGYHNTSAELRAAFESAVVHREKSLTTASLTAIFQGLSRGHHVQWIDADLSTEFRQCLLARFQKFLSNENDHNDNDDNLRKEQNENESVLELGEKLKLMSNVLYALGRLRAGWTVDVSVSLQQLIWSSLSQTLILHLTQQSSSPPATATMISSANGLQSKQYSSFPIDAYLSVVGGTARMRVPWTLHESRLSPLVHACLYHINRALTVTAAATQPRSDTAAVAVTDTDTTNVLDLLLPPSKRSENHANKYANLLWSLSQFEVNYADLSPALQRQLMQSTHFVFPVMRNFEFIWTLWALAKMNISFHDLPADTRQRDVIERAESVLVTANEQELGVMVWTFGRLKVPLQDMSQVLAERILMGIDLLVQKKLRANSHRLPPVRPQ